MLEGIVFSLKEETLISAQYPMGILYVSWIENGGS